MDQNAAEFVKSKTLAVVGVSKRKFGGSIYRTLKARGFKVYPVHPLRESFDGDPCVRKLTELPDGVDAAVVAVSPLHAEDVVRDARVAGIKKLWFQQGADFRDVALMAEAYGIKTVTGKCILMYAGDVTGIHAVHRFFAKVFKTY
jgi:hypothetical protein